MNYEKELEKLKQKESFVPDDYADILMHLQEEEKDFERKLNSFLNIILAKDTNNNQKTLKEILFALPLLTEKQKEEEFYKKAKKEIKNKIKGEAKLFDLDDYPCEDSYHYGTYDGIKLLQMYDKKDGTYDIFYFLGRDEKDEFFFAFRNLDKKQHQNFEDGMINLKEIFNKKDTKYVFSTEGYIYMEEKDYTPKQEDVYSEKVDVNFFGSVWGEKEKIDQFYLI